MNKSVSSIHANTLPEKKIITTSFKYDRDTLTVKHHQHFGYWSLLKYPKIPIYTGWNCWTFTTHEDETFKYILYILRIEDIKYFFIQYFIQVNASVIDHVTVIDYISEKRKN